MAYIGDNFNYPHVRKFDSTYLRHLFDYAYGQAAAGSEWKSQVPMVTPSAWQLEQARARAKQTASVAAAERSGSAAQSAHGNP